MDRYSYEILSELKAHYITVCGQKTFQIQDVGTNVSARQFYLKELNDNLIEPMSEKVFQAYSGGNGNELSDKMLALRSSSAMTYNLLGNGSVNFQGDNSIGEGLYEVSFEKQLHTLRRSEHGLPANLDAFLYCQENREVIACEMKMTEWIFNRPCALRNAYLIPDNYDNPTVATAFIDAAKNIIAPPSDYEDTQEGISIAQYASALRQYDAFQMLKHALACYNACQEQTIPIKKLTLINCVWELPNSNILQLNNRIRYEAQLALEHNEFADFYIAMQPVFNLFQKSNIAFDIRYYNLFDFMRTMSLSDAKKQYLKRYTFQ